MDDFITAEEYELLGFLLDYTDDGDSDYIVLQQETENDFILENEEFFKEPEGDLEGLDPAMLLDFLSKNKKVYNVEAKNVKTEKPVKPVTALDLEKAFDGDGSSATGWEAFYKKYPDSTGETLVSRAGFDKTKTAAMVCLFGMHDYLCAEGNLYIFKKENNKWQLNDIIWLWTA
ncbi:MAG: hypothetical protein A2452_07885 [Candidatus Firestonebacteria bacterium RIFOXYC2_FULL_39_67]|nr:MAG: hypothetical protein A2536_08180 [Candidatus Firestonebacteria bacterium RIFOXYD2_FULL_39_29]OGF54478.1 MAG: hypothetical protein A2497_07410 [Candidatus Firestonebacteria bacterium RifOxyC12_full_39_7]OGF56762.1 MAG: hypothetical protein A2452_07885 [Candidatus Firestonebacteria bacterium RIFOXYC2_FULL_39_67]